MEYTIQAEVRGDKPNPRELRRLGRVPGVLYGPGVHYRIALNAKDLDKLLQRVTRSSRIVVELNGQKFTTFIKEIQHELLTDRVQHIDLYSPAPDRPVVIDVPVRLRGVARGVKEGGVLQVLRDLVRVRGPMEQIPEVIELDVSNLGVGQAIHVSDLALTGVQVLTPAEATIVSVVAPRKEEVAVAPVPGAEAAAPAPGAPAAATAPAPPAQQAPAKKEEKK
ncbi:MAG: 50S ribosomal protein L25 [Candidatus Bipolaricaulota bacterium]|nr:50S ribosomal protein L25 [Candidatus Bipolaricaulota bacterium]MCS7274823.1 50S ribosomal protein L25 [Candidatus Bipolaricaulota bacterium]MDW8111244.1 50S ribosomal protein L25 [Candidatus Bipolaricaulota bacterium]MDW8328620.1 50S ribosomal protein L25 [Candidatus Bipolaricaulota bacterium]